MPGSSVGQLSSRQTLGYLLGGWTTFVFLLMVLAGHRPFESLGAAAMVAVQFTAGFVLWQVLSRGLTHEIVGSAAMGAVFGAVLAVLSGIAFVGTPIARVGWLLPIVAAVSLIRRLRPVEGVASSTFMWLVAATLLGLSTEWTWLLPTAIGVAVLACRRSFHPVLVSLALAASLVAQGWFVAVRSGYWSQFRQGLTEIGDYVYLEAVARGSAQWANTDSVLAVDTQLGYHWLSFAWAGRVTETVDSTAMAFSSHLIQISFVAASVGMVFAVARRLGASEVWSMFGVLMTTMLVGVPIGLLHVLAVHSPSQPFVVATVLGTVLFLSSNQHLARWRAMLLAFVLVAGVVGGKASAVPAVTAAIGVLLVWRVFRGDRRQVLPLIVAISTVAVGFVFFYGGVVADGTTGSTQLKFLEVAFTEGPVSHVDRPWWLAIVGSLAILAGVAALVPGLVAARPILARSDSTLAWLLLVGSVASFAVGFVYVGERSGVTYFFNIGIALAIPVAVAATSRLQLPTFSVKWMIGLACSVVVGILIPNVMVRLSSSGVVPSLVRSGLLVAPFLAAGIIAWVIGVRSIVGPILMVMVMGASSYFAWIPRYALVQARHGISYEPGVDSMSGSPAHREAAQWLRAHSSAGDVVATNRFCNSSALRLPDCAAYWTVVSSVAGRRMYVENIEWSARSATGVLDRALQSIEFVDAPSQKSAEFLTTANVSWVFVDRSVTTTTSWEPWAEVVFENDDSFILRVLAKTGTP